MCLQRKDDSYDRSHHKCNYHLMARIRNQSRKIYFALKDSSGEADSAVGREIVNQMEPNAPKCTQMEPNALK